MRRTWSLLLIFLLCLIPLAGQEEEEDQETENESTDIEWDSYTPDLYRAGDKIFSISAGVIFPTIFAGVGLDGNSSNIKVGGTGVISYSQFLTAHLFIGGELQGTFIGTGGKNMLYIVPYGVHIGYQFIAGRFEFPIRLMTGGVSMLYQDKNHFGWIIKPGVSAYYRFNADWSFGLNLQWWMLPQWPKNKKFVFGNFLEISLSARYHF